MRSPLTSSLLLTGIAVVLLACAPPPRVEVVERDVLSVRAETEKIGGAIIRIIQPGDTLHGIAFGAGLNVNELAAWNGLSDTQHLKVGQQLRLTKPANFEAVKRPSARVTAAPKSANRPASSEPTTNKPAETGHVAKEVKNTNRVSPVRKPTATQSGPVQWSWPSLGQVIGRFSLGNGQQGIDIKGKRGQPVVAAAAGEVVYVGSGLKGYGNLIIIKHSERFLSAYAHNQQIYVDEGQRVAARHTVGAIGLDKKGREAMHFQIRKDGKPVNPLAYLPGR